MTALRLASFTSVAVADHWIWASATLPLSDTRLAWKGSATEETCGIDLSLVRAVSIAVLAAGSLTFALPLVVAKTIMLWPPLNAGSLAVRTSAAFCASVPGIVKVSLVFPPLATPRVMAATAATSQIARTSRRRRKAKWASRKR